MVQLHSAATIAGASIVKSSPLSLAVESVLAGGTLPTIAHRMASQFELARTTQEIVQHGAQFAADLTKRGRRPNPVDSILRVLHLASTHRSKTRFDDPTSMANLRDAITDAVALGRSVALALPLGGSKVANPMKTGNAFLPDVGEWVAWMRLAAMARAITNLTGVPARVLIVPDAPLHTADLGMPATEAAAHLRQAGLDLETLGIDDIVSIADTAASLPREWSGEVAMRAAAAAERARREPEFRADVAAQVQALLFATNLRLYPWPAERHLLVTRALVDANHLPADVVADANAVRAEVERKVFHYIGVNHALRTLTIPERLVRATFGDDYTMLRLTVHAKPGEPQPLLVPSNKRARPGLLPMHGIGLRFTNERGQTRFATAFALEAAMAAMVAVDEQSGRTLWVEPGRVAGLARPAYAAKAAG